MRGAKFAQHYFAAPSQPRLRAPGWTSRVQNSRREAPAVWRAWANAERPR